MLHSFLVFSPSLNLNNALVSMFHHRRSICLKNYDYAQSGAYFITVCTRNRENLFGEIVDGEMHVNHFGSIVRKCWDDLPHHYSGVELDAFVVMPNHVHAIIMVLEDAENPVGAIHESPLPSTDKRIMRRRMLVPKIIGRFKMNSAKRINQMRGTEGGPVWQRNYFEHVIRDEKSLNKIREYILTNSQRWELDKENTQGTRNDEFDRWFRSLEGDPLKLRTLKPD